MRLPGIGLNPLKDVQGRDLNLHQADA
jgi:hypothetical protein